jgi:hypothetical protein
VDATPGNARTLPFASSRPLCNASSNVGVARGAYRADGIAGVSQRLGASPHLASSRAAGVMEGAHLLGHETGAAGSTRPSQVL